jgi:hypothetical protein
LVIVGHDISMYLSSGFYNDLSALRRLAGQADFQDAIFISGLYALGIDGEGQREAAFEGAETHFQVNEAPEAIRTGRPPAALHHQFVSRQRQGNGLCGHSGQLQAEHQALGGFIEVGCGPKRRRGSLSFQQDIETAAHLFLQAVKVPDYADFDETIHRVLKKVFRFNLIILMAKSRLPRSFICKISHFLSHHRRASALKIAGFLTAPLETDI